MLGEQLAQSRYLVVYRARVKSGTFTHTGTFTLSNVAIANP